MVNHARHFGPVLLVAAALALSCAGGPLPAPGATGGGPASAATAGARGGPAQPPQATRVDPLARGGGEKAQGFVALEEELRRAMKELGAKGDPAPYFIGYQVHDRREVRISAQYGALLQSNDQRTRVLDVDLRVGTHKLDSTHPMRRGDFDFMSFAGGPAPLPIDDSPAAIRAVAWSETDRRYKAAVERLLKIKTQKEVKAAEEDESDDFSRERPITFAEPPASIQVDIPAWEARVRRLSARFRGAAELHDAQVSLEVTTLNKWIANTEGSSIQAGRNYVRVLLRAGTRAVDGMELERYETLDAASFEGLPDEAAMDRAADAIIADLRALRRAPLAEPFIGPAILEGKAAGVFFHEIFGHRVEGHRQKKEDEGQTFAKKVGEPVMPDFISVYDDPTIRRIGREDLNGFYRFDDEAVAAQRATLVDKGVLRGFLMGRSPTRGFNQSNGHGRRQEGQAAVARQANLVVEPSLALPAAELRARLREEARRQGKPYGLLFKDISGGFTFTDRYMPQAFKVLPILVYRIWTDGRPDELVRGADLVGTPLASLSKILAAADDYQTFNGFCGAESGYVPVSATSPSLLVQQIEVERKDKGNEKPPVLAAPETPPAAGVAPPDDAVVRRALEDELKRAMGGLQVGDQPKPYFISYTIQDTNIAQVSATFGAATAENRTRSRSLRTGVRVGDPSFDNSNFSEGGFGSLGGGGFAILPTEDDAAALRQDLWLRTDEAYKRAVETLSKKKAAAASQAAADEDKVPDFDRQPPAQTVSAPALRLPDTAPLRDLAQKLSVLFQQHPGVVSSRVTAVWIVARQRFLSSETTWADERQGFVRIEVSADAQADDGMKLKDRVSFTAASVEGLPPLAEMQNAVRSMAGELEARKRAPQAENGTALVLFEGLAAGQIVKTLLADHLGGTPPSKTAGNESRGRQQESDLAGKIGQRVAAAFLSAHDDPLKESAPGGGFLLGSYRADDDGVPAQRVSLIESGVLKTLLMSRTPSKEVTRSNGHGRASRFGSTRGGIGNLFFTAKGGLTRKALVDRMVKEARSRGAEAYVVRLVDDASTGGISDFGDPESMMILFSGMGARGGGAPPVRPLVAYRVRDGKEERVRGFTLEGMLPKALKDLTAAGKEPFVLNFIDATGGAGSPASIVTPALLFSDVEVRKQTGRNRKPPLYPHPFFAAAPQPQPQR